VDVAFSDFVSIRFSMKSTLAGFPTFVIYELAILSFSIPYRYDEINVLVDGQIQTNRFDYVLQSQLSR
jgi:hypothetical protein